MPGLCLDTEVTLLREQILKNRIEMHDPNTSSEKQLQLHVENLALVTRIADLKLYCLAMCEKGLTPLSWYEQNLRLL